MYCRNCGNEMHDEAVVCVKCGVPVGKGNKFCNHCGIETSPEAAVCVQCGVAFQNVTNSLPGSKSKVIAGLLGILLGCYGAHNFYLGYNKKAIIQIILTLGGLVFCGIPTIASVIWGIIEGIQYLTGSKKTDAKGNPLKD